MSLTSIFDETSNEALLRYLNICNSVKKIEVQEFYDLALTALKYYKGDSGSKHLLSRNQALEVKWYQSLRAGVPDYSVYSDDCFVSDIWSCWLLYSRKYLLSLASKSALGGGRSIVDDLSGIKTVADLGCGFGYTTAGLKELFPRAKVYGTNIPGCLQYQVASKIGAERGFKIIPDVAQIGSKVDLVFASEYFEHFERPGEHLIRIINQAAPSAFIIANSFGSKSVGHFDTYLHRDMKIANTKIGKTFNNILRVYKYKMVKTNFWNNRPYYWKKE